MDEEISLALGSEIRNRGLTFFEKRAQGEAS